MDQYVAHGSLEKTWHQKLSLPCLPQCELCVPSLLVIQSIVAVHWLRLCLFVNKWIAPHIAFKFHSRP